MTRALTIIVLLSLCGCVNWGVNAETEKANAIKTATDICTGQGQAIKIEGIKQDGGNGAEWHTVVQYLCVPR